ncbi:hypothetical protein DEI81_00305 [Curtobacterium sp. MCBD17_013]|uniref:hypothetical protein n=1 Tax=Curtobacterium sp. MCBD17_013 TaxID=2175668 RepID=UPI000DAA2E36|nr:hypothetical protein [Curtobacterium sp. MCBD17_013]PZF66122.1 hypothetical protein DEI81_00305 [Curtobacterium sp. MCBD17_013]
MGNDGLWAGFDDEWAPDPLADRRPRGSAGASVVGMTLLVGYAAALLGAYLVLLALVRHEPHAALTTPSWWVQVAALLLGLLSVGSVIAATSVLMLGVRGTRSADPGHRTLGVVVVILGAMAVPVSFWVLVTGGVTALFGFGGF